MKDTSFIGRERELRLLRELNKNERTALAVIYGRRRVGKSLLMAEAFRNSTVISFEGLENRPKNEQIKNVANQLTEQFPKLKHNQTPIQNWHDCLFLLYQQVKDSSVVIIFDEFQWMANYRSELVSELKAVWDRYFSKMRGTAFILCGSVASFMLNKTIRSKALYGRIELVIHLKPFQLSETKQLLAEHGNSEILLAHLLVGGIPLYLQLLKAKPSIYLGMQELAFEEHGYFFLEFERIFTSHFGKKKSFNKIVRLLSAHQNGLTRKELSAKSDLSLGGTLSQDLNDLEIAGIITYYIPFHLAAKSQSSNARQRIYRLTDPYLRFYLNFIENNTQAINQQVDNLFNKISTSQTFASWCGVAFEILCLQHTKKLAAIMGFNDVEYSVGPYFSKKTNASKPIGVQVDLVFDRKDFVTIACEIKYKSTPIGVEIIPEMERKISLLPKVKNKTLRPVLITKSEPTKELVNRSYFSHIILAEQLLE